VERPSEVVDLIDDFISSTGQAADAVERPRTSR
jgi:hypothetical protein